jgi:hypothetical protein
LIAGFLMVRLVAQPLGTGEARSPDNSLAAQGSSQAIAKSSQLEAINVVDHSGKTSVDISITPAVKPAIFELANPARLVLDFPGTIPDLRHDHIPVSAGAGLPRNDT